MGKSSKKTVPKVDAAPAKETPGKSMKKGKREAEEIIDKKLSLKRQKKGGDVEEATKKKKVEEKKKVVVDDDTTSSSESEEEIKKVPKSKSLGAAKNGIAAPAKKKDESSDESTDSEEDAGTSKKLAPAKNGPVIYAKMKDDSDSEDESSSSEDEKAPAVAAKNSRTAVVNKPDDSESEEETGSSDDDVPQTKKVPAAKGGPVGGSKKKDDSESEEESSSSDDDDVPATKKVPAPKAGPVAGSKKKDDSESEEESSSSDDDVPATKKVPGAKGGPVAGSKKKDESSDDSDSYDKTTSSDNEDASGLKDVLVKKPSSVAGNKQVLASSLLSCEKGEPQKKKSKVVPTGVASAVKPTVKAVKTEESGSSEEESSDESSDDEPKKAQSAKKPTGVASAVKPAVKAVKEEESGSSEEESSDESSDDEPKKAQSAKKSVIMKQSSSVESSSEDDEESSEEEEKQPSKTPKKKDTDVEMVDALPEKGNFEKGSFSSERKVPKTPATAQSQTSGSKTLFVGNLSFSVEQADVENFFKDCGELVDVRFATHPDGAFKGFGHVEFATAEAAQKALEELNGQELLGRGVRLDLAAERGAYTPQSGKDRSSIQRGFGSQAKATIYVRGFDRNVDEYEIKGALREHFESCGEVTRISVPKDDSGLKGFAYIDFTNNDGVNKALEFDQSELKEFTITVEEARPRSDVRDSSGGGRGSGGRSGGRDGGRFGGRDGGRFGGRFGGRDGGRRGGGRFGSGGGRGGGGRGRGTPNRPSMAAVATGKKTKFDD